MGYGDIIAVNQLERTLVIFISFISSMIVSYDLFYLFFIYKNLNDENNRNIKRLQKINKQLKDSKLPSALKNKVNRYLKYKIS
jgi:hypothetical protein